jgi:hypothetical protein
MINIASISSDRLNTDSNATHNTVILGAIKNLKAEQAADAAAMDFPWDVASPEGLIAFFGEKLRETNTELKGLMQKQQDRSALVNDMGQMIALLGTDGKELKPDSPNWGEFQRLAALVKPALGESDEANAIRQTMPSATGPGLDGTATKQLGSSLKTLSENLQADNQMDAIRVQELVGRVSQIMSLASNILHKFDEAAMAPIQNVK